MKFSEQYEKLAKIGNHNQMDLMKDSKTDPAVRKTVIDLYNLEVDAVNTRNKIDRMHEKWDKLVQKLKASGITYEKEWGDILA